MSEERPRVLFVDDDENILRALRRLFRREPWETRFVTSGAEALTLAASEGSFDVVVTDQRMPDMTGVEFLREVRRRWPAAIRVILSGYTDVQSILDAVNEGAIYKFLAKPWEDDVLLEAVTGAVEVVHLRRDNQRLHEAVCQQRDELEAINRGLTEGARQDLLVRAVFEELPLGIVVLGEDGEPALCNREASRLLGPGRGLFRSVPERLEAAGQTRGVRVGPSAPLALFSWEGTVHLLWEE